MKPQQPSNNANTTRGITAEDLVVGGKYVPHSKRVKRPYSFNDVIEEMKEKQVDYLVYKGKDEGSHYFKASEWMNHVVFHPDEVTPYHEPNQCCGRCDGVNDFCINDESTMMELKSLHEPNQTTMIAAKCTCGRHTYCDSSESFCVNNIFTDNSNQTTMDYTEQPFNLETALKHPEWVRTRDGREIDFIKDYPETRGFFSIVSITKCGSFYLVNKNGKVGQLESDFDLILCVPYVTRWFNVYKNTGYLSKEEADSSATLEHRIACVPVKIPAI